MSFFSRVKRLIELSREPVAVPQPEAKEEKGFNLDLFNLAYWPKKAGIKTFEIPKPPPFVVPKRTDGKKLAMDDNAAQLAPVYEFAGTFNNGFGEGLGFPGYSYLSELTQRPEYRRPSEIISKELTREWLRFITVGDEDKQNSGSLWARLKVLKEEFSRLIGSVDPIDEVRRDEIKQEWADLIEQSEAKGTKAEKIKAITEEFKRLKVRALFQRAMEQDGWFGRSHIWLETCAPDNLDELVLPLELDTVKIGKGDLKRLILVEAMWTYPNRYDAVDPLNEHFFKPYTWFVMGKEVHSSRLLTFVSRPVPDILKPVYQFGGMSLSQMLKPYVDNWLRTRQSVSNLVSNFSIMILKTDLAQLLQSGVSFGLLQRMQAFNASRDNNGLMVADKNMEEVENVSVPLGSLDHLQAQAQEHMCAVSGLPLVKAFGLTPSGLNASADGEIKVYYDWCESIQEAAMSPNVEYLSKVVQLHLFGEIDHSIQPIWEPLWSLNELEQAQARKTEAEIDTIYADAGVLDRTEVRRRIADDPKSPYGALEVDRETDPVGQIMEDPELLAEIVSRAVAGRAKAEAKNQGGFSSEE